MANMTAAASPHLDLVLRDAWGELRPLLEAADIQEIMINAPDSVWVERGGILQALPIRFSACQAWNVIQLLATRLEQSSGLARRQPLLDVAVGCVRISAVSHPVAVRGHALCLRRHGAQLQELDHFVGYHSPDPCSGMAVCTTTKPQPLHAARRWEADSTPLPAGEPGENPQQSCSPGERRSEANWPTMVLKWLAEGRNLLVSGATSSGKTTFLNALLRRADPAERIVSIEDTHELQLLQPNSVSFEAHSGLGVGLRELVRQALRFRPDRLVVGEVRGAEAFDLLQAMNTGHGGCLGTLHANSALDALYRLEQMVLQAGVGWPLPAIRLQIARCIHGVIHLQRRGGRRQVTQLLRIKGYCHDEYQTESVA